MLRISAHLRALRDDVFSPAGFDIRLVGGSVRDAILGVPSKDVDLCTDASPKEQVDLYNKHGVRFYETGLQHGTLTINLGPKEEGELYEITSLRTESNHDGRWADMTYTRDWEADLGRRDLTINAMAMDFDGNLHDPFGGRSDLRNGIVRFVGLPDDRMREDYLRILRWFRFHARIAGDRPMDEETCDAVVRNARGLKTISRERIWSEVQRIVSSRSGGSMLKEMMRMGVCAPCGLPHGSWRDVERALDATNNPVSLMAVFVCDPARMQNLGRHWRWSNEEKRLGGFVVESLADDRCDLRWMLAHDGASKAHVTELARVQGRAAELEGILEQGVPDFPLRGSELIDAGFKPGVEFSQWLDALKTLWADGGYVLTKTELLAHISTTHRLDPPMVEKSSESHPTA